jgi:hypothetical protein
MNSTEFERLVAVEHKVAAIAKTLETFIAWTAKSANSPIRLEEAVTLIDGLHRQPRQRRK